ncbi:TPA: hypothetical protein ANIA_11351 [Aspergillus nidulans FGSC A4]|uniref:Uncharacterized protein n=1 Tax=Emericella nidulans (strain FGSC A4 / ATCC 38163 / CBS 112.46 / NRRL 194 / M139) TaxID=227321 RepID=C8VKM7_EMENI|nr:TPA: hypothetical protein ANIA_11351 [Aspergillus nidulans FGSC A4]
MHKCHKYVVQYHLFSLEIE